MKMMVKNKQEGIIVLHPESSALYLCREANTDHSRQ